MKYNLITSDIKLVSYSSTIKWLFGLYRFESLSLKLMRVCENTVLRKVSGHRRAGNNRRLEKIHNVYICYLYSSQNTIGGGG